MIIWRRHSTKGILFIFLLLILIAGLFLYAFDMRFFFFFGVAIIIVLILFSRFLKLEASDWLPIYFLLISLVIVLVLIPISILRGKSYISYVASITLAITVVFLYYQFQKKILLFLIFSFLILYIIYFIPLIFLREPNFFYWGIISAIFIGLLASFVTLIGSLCHRKEAHINQVLASATLLSFVVALVVLFLSGAGEGNRSLLIEEILPIGSWIVPILSYYYGRLFSLERAEHSNSTNKNFSLLLSGLILSFLLGFIFGNLSFAFPAAVENIIHPYHYPLMWSFWVLIVSYFFLLDTDAWNPSRCFDLVEKWMTD